MKKIRRSLCPISYSLDLFGDRWTLLILRDMVFMGKQHYREFLKSGEGIATNILADRLSRLESAGLVTKESDPADAKRYVYSLTEKGLDVLPVLVEIIVWGASHDPDTPVTSAFLDRLRSDRAGFLAEVRQKVLARAK
ncbi:MAG: helix-turn-helix domain-containing protein [Candidatus Eisenbacteria bacterium]